MKNEIEDLNIHKEIDLLEGIINRMAENAFKAKGWYITLLVALIALSKDNIALAVGVVPIISVAFWYLTAFFLCTERNYRMMYKHVIRLRSMGYNYNLYRLDLGLYSKDLNYEKVKNCLFRVTIWPLYLIPIVGSVLFIILNY